MNIVLIGFMGTGKTVVGRLLAKRLGRRFIDVDQWIETRQRRSIAQIFRASGEPRFRRLERAAIARLVRQTNLVIATGGGAVLDPVNLQRLKHSGTVICLSASARTIFQRVSRTERRPGFAPSGGLRRVSRTRQFCEASEGREAERPLLAHADRRRVVVLLRQRRPAYAQADWVVDTTGRSVAQVACAIQEHLERTVGIVYLPGREELVHVSPL